MKACIRRGAAEVGGSCVEVESSGRRLVLDVGLPLDMEGVPMRDLLPDVPGLWADADGSLAAVLLSHGHPDHSGLADLVTPGVRVFAGQAAARIAHEASFFIPSARQLRVDGVLRDGQPLRIGPFTVTPVLVDHSAFDAYALVVEADGRRLVYSGDTRAHGRKPGAMGRLAAAADGAAVAGDSMEVGPTTAAALNADAVMSCCWRARAWARTVASPGPKRMSRRECSRYAETPEDSSWPPRRARTSTGLCRCSELRVAADASS